MASPRVVFMGGRQAGCIGLLTVRAAGCTVPVVVAYDAAVRDLAAALELPVAESIHAPQVRRALAEADALVCVHGLEIVPPDLLALPRLGGLNVHPCLFRYKGAHPVERLLRDGWPEASVGVHRMTELVDEGDVLSEMRVDVRGKRTADEVYNALYPLYACVLLDGLRRAGLADAHLLPR